jgi:hypothetical protein
MKKDFRWRGWIVLASLLVALVILSTTLLFNGMHKSTVYAASKPSISVPAVIRAFHPFKISGKGFAPGDWVTVYSTNAPIGTFQCGNNGRFTGTATVSDPVVQGTHQLSAIANSNLTATVNYTYLPGLILYDNYVAVLKKGGPGTLIFLAGAGFTANETVNIYWGKNPTPITQATTDAYGNLNTYDVRFNAPTGIAPGKYPITVKRTQQEPEVVSTNFTLLPPELATSGGILAGQAINAKLSGFQENEQVAISWNVNGNQTIATIAVDTNGAANTTFTPPSAPKGPHTLTATGNTSGLRATSITNIGPGISLDPGTVNVTGTTTVNGGGYTPGEKVNVYLQNTSNGVITTTVNAQGGFSVPLTMPATYQTNITYYVYAVSSNGSEKAKTQLFFQPPSIEANGDEVYGGSLTITGQGFANAEIVTLSWQSITDTSATQLGTVVAASDGTFTFTTTVPGAPYSTSGFPFPFNASIIAQGNITQIQASTTFFVIHNLIATPNTGTVGSTIALVGGGFGSTEQVAISLQGIPLTTVTTDANGSFNTTFVVPPQAEPGNRASNLVAVGSTSHLANDISFGVLTAITITPQQGPSGTSITISGTGFVPEEQVTIEWTDPTTNRGTVLTTLTIPPSTFSFTTTVTAPANLTSGATYYIEVPNTYTGDTVKAAFVAQ